VTAFLSNYFHKYVEYDFTADLEDQLDKVSAGEADYKDVLRRFWRDFSAAIAETAELRITEVLEKINDVLAPHLFPANADGTDPRLCPNCGAGRLSMRTARSGGAFIGCSNYPECKYTRPFGPPGEEGETSAIPPDGRMLGTDAQDDIWLHDGRFGPYVQRGVVTEADKKPPRQSVPKDWPLETLDLAQALKLLNLPREVGAHPEDGEAITATIGRYGPYIKHNKTSATLPAIDDVFTVGMNMAVELLAAKLASRGGGRGAAAQPLKALGDHPSGGAMSVMPGRFGPYVKWEKINATIPKEVAPEDLTPEMAIALVDEKAAKGGKGKKPAAKKAAPKKPPAKKTAAKKTAAKKPASKSRAATASDASDVIDD
jgi:DNA topoisomerase-1